MGKKSLVVDGRSIYIFLLQSWHYAGLVFTMSRLLIIAVEREVGKEEEGTEESFGLKIK